MIRWLLRLLGIEHDDTRCRCCKVELTATTGNVGFYPLGSGFCFRCAVKILRNDR
jgi:recombinational DNA repair protein (RecF pathway)